LTIANVDEAAQLDGIEREFLQLHGAQLPVLACVHEVLLIENASGRWGANAAHSLQSHTNDQTPSEVIIASLAFLIFWVLLIMTILVMGQHSPRLRPLRGNLIAQWRPARP
jgi:hypothetical protein